MLLLLWLSRRRLRATHFRWITALCAVVLVTTAPWDNWAVYRGIWSFDPARVTEITIPWRGVQWRLPAEEYAFFLLETVMVSLLTILFLPVPCPRDRKAASPPRA